MNKITVTKFFQQILSAVAMENKIESNSRSNFISFAKNPVKQKPSHYHSWHGLRTPNEAFFYWNPELLGFGRQFWQINSGAFGVLFLDKLSVPILIEWVPWSCFPLFKHYFYKKLSLFIHIPNIYLGLGFEFGFEFEFGP